jgi:hypothetical protein
MLILFPSPHEIGKYILSLILQLGPRKQRGARVGKKSPHPFPSSNWVVASFVRGWGGGKELNVLSNLQLI